MLNYVKRIPNESVVEITGEVVEPEQEIKSCTQPVEVMVSEVWLLDKADFRLPFQYEDAARRLPDNYQEGSDDSQFSTVNQDTRLNNRVLDLRTPANQAIVRLNSKFSHFVREFLNNEEFVEIHTPKLVAGTTEGGSQVFKTNYYGQDA